MNKHVLPPSEYNKIVQGIELEEITLKSINADLVKDQFLDVMRIQIEMDASYKNSTDGFEAFVDYKLLAKNNSKKIGFNMKASYSAVFKSSEDISDDFFEIYKEYGLSINVWPFFRELVANTTRRMNINSMTLPLLKK